MSHNFTTIKRNHGVTTQSKYGILPSCKALNPEKRRRARSFRIVGSHLTPNLAYAVTFKDAFGYLTCPSLQLYDKFILRFAFRTTQSSGLILFNSDLSSADYLLFELHQARLFFSFDMGSGFQRNQLSANRIDDDNWHTVELARYDVRSNVIISTVDKDELTELKTHLPVIRGKRSRNFNLADQLYLGGAHKDVYYRWRERINYRFGFQGCFANLSVNDQFATDPLTCQNNTYFRNTTFGDVTAGCFTLPTSTKRCENRLTLDSLNTYDEPSIFEHTLSVRDKTCRNGGTCVQLWTGLRCLCETTAFKGRLCDIPGTVLQMVSSDMPHAKNGSLIKYDPVWRTNSYVLLTYTNDARHTLKDEFVFGIQLDWINSILEIPSEDNLEMICTLLYVTNEKHAGDFLHVYMVGGFLQVDCDYGGGYMHFTGPNITLSDGYFHRIRGFRRGIHLILEIDNRQSTHKLQGKMGRQFNDQSEIWLGRAPLLNISCFHSLYLIGVYYNGLLLNDLIAGLYHRSFIKVTAYGSAIHVPKFSIRLAQNGPFTWNSETEHLQSDAKNFDEHNRGQHHVRTRVSSITHSKLKDQQRNRVAVDQQSRGEANTMYAVNGTAFTLTSRMQSYGISEVNIWLVVCLAGAGCVILCSITLLAFRLPMICNRCSSHVAQNQNYDIRKCSPIGRETHNEKALKVILRTSEFPKPCTTSSISACKYEQYLSNNPNIKNTEYAPETSYGNSLSYYSTSSPIANRIKHIPSCPVHMTFPTHLVYDSQSFVSFASPLKEQNTVNTDYTTAVANVPQERTDERNGS